MKSDYNALQMVRSAMVLGLVLMLVACGSARRSEPIVGPMKMTDASVQRGKILFDMHCFKCHTQGAGGMAPALNDKPLPRALIRFQIRQGLGTMPAFSKQDLSDRDVEAILDYMVALRHHGD